MELKELRNQIDKIDDELTKLFIERMKLSREVAEEKLKNNLPTNNMAREREIVIHETSKMDDDIKCFGKQLYQTLFSTSKAYQSRFIEGSSKMLTKIKQSISNGVKPFPDSSSVACQGVFGAYSQIATDKMFSVANVTYFKDWDGVFNAVEKGLCRFGVLPIENSSVGSVNEVYDLMREHKFYIVKALKLKISHNLLAPKGVKLNDIKEIISHEKAISQCSEFLKSKDVKVTICANTALAAKTVAESGRKDVACISSKECAQIYNLDVLATDVNDTDNNYTRFIAISKDLEVYENANKISIMVTLPHESGSLNALLNSFSTLNLNLTKLESRPLVGSSFEFAFYFDFEANVLHHDVQNLIAELDNTIDKFVFLGSYEERA